MQPPRTPLLRTRSALRWPSVARSSARSLATHGRVEFAAELAGPSRTALLGDSGLRTEAGVVRWVSTSPASDALVKSLYLLFATRLGAMRMADSVEFAALSLEGDPADLAAGPVKLRLFFEPNDPDRHAELYLNLDLRARSIELHEKDEAYRRPLIPALTRWTFGVEENRMGS